MPFRGGKGRQWEGGIREPYIIHVPGLTKPGTSSDVIAIGMDFYPTILELAGLPLRPEQHVDGVSLVPVLSGKNIPERALYWHYPHYGNQGGEPSSIIRSKEWKLIYYHEDGRVELYNLINDMGEVNNVAAAYPEKVSEMQKRLNHWLADTGARFPARDPRYSKERFDQKIENARTAKMEALEKQHAEFLDPEWEPAGNARWWGSAED